VVLLWLALNYWLAVSCKDPGGTARVCGPKYFPQHTTYVESVAPFAED
jgi:hypothetical protein